MRNTLYWDIQDGAMSLAKVEVVAFLDAKFQGHVIMCKAKVVWLPYCPDLHPFIISSSPRHQGSGV